MTQQEKIQLIINLCNQCDVVSEQLAQTVGQPQWIIDAILQGKVTNDVTVDAIVGRLLQIYRKKLGCELEDAEKGALVSIEQLKRWESGKKIDYEKVELYVGRLSEYAKSINETPQSTDKNKILLKTKHIDSIVSDTEEKRIIEIPNDDTRQRYGKLISLMVPYVISLGGTKIATVLGKLGYNKRILDRIKNGTSQEITQYREVAVFCIKAIAFGENINKKRWGCPEGMSWIRFKLIIEDKSGFSATIDDYEMLWKYLKDIKKEKIVKKEANGGDYKVSKSQNNTKRNKRHRKISGIGGGVVLTPQEHAVRHMSYSSTSDGFDYGITDT